MSSTDLMQLSLDTWSTLVCLKKGFSATSRHDFSIVDASFDLSSAIREGFFDDMVVRCANGTEVSEVMSSYPGQMVVNFSGKLSEAFQSNIVYKQILSLVWKKIANTVMPSSIDTVLDFFTFEVCFF